MGLGPRDHSRWHSMPPLESSPWPPPFRTASNNRVAVRAGRGDGGGMSLAMPFPETARLYGVVTTGIYCLPACPSRPPKPENARFFADRGEAEAAGLRACRRCRPDRDA